jgi:hypothetical protein
MSDSQTVHAFESGRNAIRASLSEFKGKTYVDLRVWYQPEPGAELKPTQKGVTVPLDSLDDLEAAVQALREASEGRGLRSS